MELSAATVWWVLAGIAVAVELSTGTFYMLMLALGLAAGAIASHVGFGVPLQIVAVAFLVYLGWAADCILAAAITGTCGLGVALWRTRISRQYADVERLDDKHLARAQFELEGNAALAGLMWSAGTVGIYPALQGTTATTYVAMIFGSITVAAFFMTLAGRA